MRSGCDELQPRGRLPPQCMIEWRRMKKRVLFVASGQSFLVKAMVKQIQAAAYEVVLSEPDIVEISQKEPIPDIFIVYLEGDLHAFNGTLKYLKKLKTEEGVDRVLYLIGSPAELDAAYAVISRGFVNAAFTRPVNIMEVVNRLNILITDESEFHGKKRILVVDDDSTMLRTMNNWFSAKYEVFMANSGMNAISLLTQKKVDLILLDYEMPVVSGLQVFEMLRSEPATANIPVIFLTSKDDRETVMKVLAAKPEKYLLKTRPAEELIKSVDDFFKGN